MSDSDDIQGSTVNSVIATTASAGISTIAGFPIPAQVSANCFKAFGRLCSALVDVPVAYLEGIAAEKRAETEGRVQLIKTSSEQIAAQMKVPEEYVRAAGQKFAHRIVREQQNLDAVTTEALKQIQATPSTNLHDGVVPPISDDWLNRFENEARNVSSEEMRKLFGKVLAGEIRKPSSYSLRTIKILGELSTECAEIFRRFCTLAMVYREDDGIHDARVFAMQRDIHRLRYYGLGFDRLSLLQECGLVIPELGSTLGYQVGPPSSEVVPDSFWYQEKHYRFEAGGEKKPNIPISGPALSSSGRELFDLVDLDVDCDQSKQYTSDLLEHLRHIKINLVQVAIT